MWAQNKKSVNSGWPLNVTNSHGVRTKKVSAKSSVSDEYVLHPTDSDFRGIQPTKAQKSSAGVSPSFSAATTTAVSALATISRDLALEDDSGSEREMEEAEE
jgi:hypothetical protein